MPVNYPIWRVENRLYRIAVNGVFTLHGNGTWAGTGNWTSTIGNNGSRFFSQSNGAFTLTATKTETEDTGFYGITWRCSYCTETDKNTDSH